MKHITLLLLFFSPLLLEAQLWSEDFDGSNTTNAPVLPAECYGSSRDYIGYVCADGDGCTNEINADFNFVGSDGIYFGVRDMDHNGCAGNLAGETLNFNAVDISSCGGSSILYICFTAAESRNQNGDMGAEWGSSNMREDTWDGSSFLTVTASIDGATAATVTAIEDFDGSDTRPGIDINCNGGSDDAGEPELTETFTNYCFELPSFGTSLDLTFNFGGLNTGGEDLALDDIEVHCTDNTATLPGTLLAACTPFVDNSNAPLWLEDFDGSNTTNPTVIDAGCSIVDSRDYFGVVCLDGGPCGNDDINADYNYANTSGSFFGARDIDGPCGGTPFGTFSASGIDISGCSAQLYLCFSVAESNSAAENDSGGNFDSWDGNSQLTVYTTFSDGTELAITDLQSSDGSNSIPAFDTSCDLGSASGPAVTDAFTNYCFAMLPNGATSVDISFEITGLNTGGEDVAIDDIGIYCTDIVGTLPGTLLTSCNISRSALPVALTYFKGETVAKGASLLSWETAQEINNDYFDLEYSTDGAAFTSLAQVMGAESSNAPTQYAYEHEFPLGELNYYRLKQVDLDGTFTFSDVVVLRKEGTSVKSKIYPNPSSNELVYEGTEATLTIYNYLGKQVQQVDAQSGTKKMDIRALRAGTYILEILKSDSTREVRRFVKTK
ncbi:MAG: T9SS type A sorting domain-containing protein [Lewinella sp.]